MTHWSDFVKHSHCRPVGALVQNNAFGLIFTLYVFLVQLTVNFTRHGTVWFMLWLERETSWRLGKQMEPEVNSISLWTKKWKYTPDLPFGITEDEQSGISNYPWKIKGCSERFKRNIICKSLRPVVHLSVARVSLRAAIGPDEHWCWISVHDNSAPWQ